MPGKLFTSDGQIRMFELNMDEAEITGDRYLIERVEVSHETALGIALPGQTPETTGWQAGRILKVGNGHRLEADVKVPMFFHEGDLVLCERFSGRELRIRGKTYVLMNQTQIFCKVPERGINETSEAPADDRAQVPRVDEHEIARAEGEGMTTALAP